MSWSWAWQYSNPDKYLWILVQILSVISMFDNVGQILPGQIPLWWLSIVRENTQNKVFFVLNPTCLPCNFLTFWFVLFPLFPTSLSFIACWPSITSLIHHCSKFYCQNPNFISWLFAMILWIFPKQNETCNCWTLQYDICMEAGLL